MKTPIQWADIGLATESQSNELGHPAISLVKVFQNRYVYRILSVVRSATFPVNR